MGNLDYERVLRQTPPVCWQVMTLVILEWVALQYGYLDFSYTFFGSPAYKHKLGALLFGGFFFLSCGILILPSPNCFLFSESLWGEKRLFVDYTRRLFSYQVCYPFIFISTYNAPNRMEAWQIARLVKSLRGWNHNRGGSRSLLSVPDMSGATGSLARFQ